ISANASTTRRRCTGAVLVHMRQRRQCLLPSLPPDDRSSVSFDSAGSARLTRLPRLTRLARYARLPRLARLPGLSRLARLARLRATALVAVRDHVLGAIQGPVLIRVGGIEVETFYRGGLGAADLSVLVRVDLLERRHRLLRERIPADAQREQRNATFHLSLLTWWLRRSRPARPFRASVGGCKRHAGRRRRIVFSRLAIFACKRRCLGADASGFYLPPYTASVRADSELAAISKRQPQPCNAQLGPATAVARSLQPAVVRAHWATPNAPSLGAPSMCSDETKEVSKEHLQMNIAYD